MKESKPKITFLFGAGADAAFGIANGGMFAEVVLGINGMAKEYDVAIKKHYEKEHLYNKDERNWLPKYHSDSGFGTYSLLKNAVRKELLDNNKLLSKGEYEREILEKANDKFKGNIKSCKECSTTSKDDDNKQICSNKSISKCENENIRQFICEHLNYMGLLDEKFHTLISPKAMGAYSFWQVVKAYSRAYLHIIKGISADIDLDNALNNPRKTYAEIRNIIRTKYTSKESYYKTIKDKCNDFNIITTNYTPFAEKIADVNEGQVAYIHGKLSRFESPFRLQVYDVERDNFEKETRNQMLFPYLFLQSGVKPIIERSQIEEYSKALKFLDESNHLVIVGYQLNVDDNHLNSLLHSFLSKSGNSITYFQYNSDGKCNVEKTDILKRLRIGEQDENANNLTFIEIDENNCNMEFEKHLDDLMRHHF
jgi:hypothetical protein